MPAIVFLFLRFPLFLKEIIALPWRVTVNLVMVAPLSVGGILVMPWAIEFLEGISHKGPMPYEIFILDI
jgi:hypothetical protein